MGVQQEQGSKAGIRNASPGSHMLSPKCYGSVTWGRLVDRCFYDGDNDREVLS